MAEKEKPKAAPRGLGAAPEKPAVKAKTGSVKARKSAARLAAAQVLYQMRLNNQDAPSAVREYVSHRSGFNLDGDVLVPADADMLKDIVMGTASRAGDIDIVLASALTDSRRGEVETLLECILRAGIYELMAHSDIDAAIIINDYLNVTTSFYDGSEPKLVNAVLDRVAKSVRD